MLKYLVNILISLDQLLNVLFLGSPDETISSRLGRNYRDTWMEKTVDFLFSWQKKPQGHCEASLEDEDDFIGGIIK
jgi:hypothetical protein